MWDCKMVKLENNLVKLGSKNEKSENNLEK